MALMADYFTVGMMMNAVDQHLPPERQACRALCARSSRVGSGTHNPATGATASAGPSVRGVMSRSELEPALSTPAERC